jgi:hypothetical protein
MPLDLPPDSLGPVPTKKQMELLKRLAMPGVTAHTWSGTRIDSGGAYLRVDKKSGRTENIKRSDLDKFYDWGWLDHVGGDFRGQDYVASERALKVIKLGKTR